MAEIKDLKDMTMRALRDLARSVLGAGTDRLKTRSELIEAILSATRRKVEGVGPEGAGTPPPKRRGNPAGAREPRPEGYMVARVAGEGAAHEAPIPLTEDRLEETVAAIDKAAAPPPAPVFDEGLGDLPIGYGDDALVALPRDPETLWIYWDYAHPTIQQAMSGLENPYARLRIFEQGRLVREIDFALESRSFYVPNLSAGRHYRAEIYFLGTNGLERRLGRPSNSIGLPPRGPSPIVDDRFATLAWGTPLTRRDLFARAEPDRGFPDTDRSALFDASRTGRPIGASENAAGPGGRSIGSSWSGSRYEESR